MRPSISAFFILVLLFYFFVSEFNSRVEQWDTLIVWSGYKIFFFLSTTLIAVLLGYSGVVVSFDFLEVLHDAVHKYLDDSDEIDMENLSNFLDILDVFLNYTSYCVIGLAALLTLRCSIIYALTGVAVRRVLDFFFNFFTINVCFVILFVAYGAFQQFSLAACVVWFLQNSTLAGYLQHLLCVGASPLLLEWTQPVTIFLSALMTSFVLLFDIRDFILLCFFSFIQRLQSFCQLVLFLVKKYWWSHWIIIFLILFIIFHIFF